MCGQSFVGQKLPHMKYCNKHQIIAQNTEYDPMHVQYDEGFRTEASV